jgi:hypothetical protein
MSQNQPRHVLEKLHQGDIPPLHQGLGVALQPQARHRGHALNVQRLAKEGVLTHAAFRPERRMARPESARPACEV